MAAYGGMKDVGGGAKSEALHSGERRMSDYSSGVGSRSRDPAGGSSAGAGRQQGGAMLCAICTGR